MDYVGLRFGQALSLSKDLITLLNNSVSYILREPSTTPCFFHSSGLLTSSIVVLGWTMLSTKLGFARGYPLAFHCEMGKLACPKMLMQPILSSLFKDQLACCSVPSKTSLSFESRRLPTQWANAPSKPIQRLVSIIPSFKSSVPLTSITKTSSFFESQKTYSGVRCLQSCFVASSKKKGSNLFRFALQPKYFGGLGIQDNTAQMNFCFQLILNAQLFSFWTFMLQESPLPIDFPHADPAP